MEKKPKQNEIFKKPKHLFEQWEAQGSPVEYVRLQSPTAPSKDKEPVEEFRTSGKKDKYLVDSMVYGEFGLVWRLNGELDHTPTANVRLARFKYDATTPPAT